ncbi:hypothetical protein [Vibrio harveyi]|uniref:hypothetical protein n=1 Tax=Vibrio harveyi TaxID=669 RepID=UPI00406887A6
MKKLLLSASVLFVLVGCESFNEGYQSGMMEHKLESCLALEEPELIKRCRTDVYSHFNKGSDISSASQTIAMTNANGNITWSSGEVSEINIHASRRQISLMKSSGLSIYTRLENTKDSPCEIFIGKASKMSICENGEVTLYENGYPSNMGFISLYNGIRLRHTGDNEWIQGTEKAKTYITK